MQFNIPAEHKKASGVYIIRNSVNEKVYVGSAVNFRKRFIAHCHELQNNKHHSAHLQRFVNKHGLDKLSFNLLELSDPNLNLVCEQKWLNSCAAHVSRGGFNIAPVTSSCLGVKHSPETRAKVSTAFKGRGFSEETRRRISAAKKGMPLGPEHRIKMREIALNRLPPSSETRAKMGDAMRGRKQSPEHIEKRAATHRGQKRSEETGRKISEAAKGRVVSDETRQKLSEARKGKTFSEEHRLKMSEAAKERWANKNAGSQAPITTEQPSHQLLLF